MGVVAPGVMVISFTLATLFITLEAFVLVLCDEGLVRADFVDGCGTGPNEANTSLEKITYDVSNTSTANNKIIFLDKLVGLSSLLARDILAMLVLRAKVT
jgi:hypothetical protein